ncbi:hypothetical protein KKA95_01670 [Patescibacteria group bacterium]|nr:hypothetical protein [Patescibacteria group bacterium]
MSEDIKQHFSKRILFLSFIFLLITGAWYVLTLFSQAPIAYHTVAPKLVFAGTHNVQVKTIYDANFHEANSNQSLFSGTNIKTGELEFAEIILENNIVRLDQNTELTLLNNNYESDPRLVFSLESGSIWVNAFDEIEVDSLQSATTFSHSIGMMTYAYPMNRTMVISGSADLALYDEEGNYLTSFSVPLNNQVTYVDTQIVSDYSLLRSSKLRKELKLASIAGSVLEDEWVMRNLEVDSDFFDNNRDLINSELAFKIRDNYYRFLSYLTFIPQTKETLTLNYAKATLNYVLGAIHKNNLKADAKELLASFDTLINSVIASAKTIEWLVETYYAIGSVEYGMPAYLAKTNILSHILDIEGPQILRTYLTDLRVALQNFSLEDDADKIAAEWLENWDRDRVAIYPTEFENQAKMLHSIILAHMDKVTTALLSIYDQTGQMRLDLVAGSNDEEEVRFAVTEERLEIASALVTAYRYLVAKQYLSNSYATLGINELETNAAAKEVFLEHAKLLAERIEYAEERMHSAATSINESDFQDYLKQKERDQKLSDSLEAFLESGTEVSVTDVPEIGDVVSKFANARISLIENDIIGLSDSPFYFEVKNARLIDRAADGSSITFDAVYDYSTNAVNEVLVSGVLFKGNFGLNDLVAVLTQNGINEADTGPEDISGLLVDENDEALRAQVVAQDLAKQLVSNEISKYEIQIGSMEQIEILDPVTLTSFRITNAYIQDPTDPRNPIKIDFDYSSSTKKAYSVYIVETGKIASNEVSLGELAGAVLGDIYVSQQKQATLDEFKNLIDRKKYFEVEDQNLNMINLNEIEFTDMSFAMIPFSISGSYDASQNIFTELNHEFYSATDADLEDYTEILAMKYVINYLSEKGLTVTEDQINMIYPFGQIQINNYTAGEKVFNFILDINGGRLQNVTLQESGAMVDSMTFEEFVSIASQ